MKTEKLIEVITKIIQREVRKEMQNLKTQILSELKQPTQQRTSSNPLTEVQKNFRNNVRLENTRQKIQYSKNPMLNDILRNTEPVPKENHSYLDVFQNDEDVINIPTDQTGRPMINAIKSGNKGVNAVFEAMNRDYSEIIAKTERVDVKEAKQQFRQQIMNRMDVMESDEPDEDFSFLDGID